MSKHLRFLALSMTLPLLLSCGGESRSEAPEIEVEGGWARAMPLLEGEVGAGTNSAVYLRLRNRGGMADRLMGGATPFAEKLEIHESSMVDDVMRMREVDGLEIPSHGAVELKPGGTHIMLVGLTRSLLEGEQIDLTLRFQRSEELNITVPVRTGSRE